MASTTLICLVIISLFSQSLQDLNNNEIEIDESNPYAEAAADIRKEQNNHDIGGLIKTIMKNGGDELFGSFLSELGKEGGGQLLQGLGSMFASQKQDKKSDADKSNPFDSLAKVGALMNSLQGLQGLLNKDKGKSKGDGTAAFIKGLGAIGSLFNQGGNGKDKEDSTAGLLQGLGALLSHGEGQEQGGEGAAALIKGVGSLFAQAGQAGQDGQAPEAELLGSVLNYFSQDDNKEKSSKTQKESKESKNIDPRAEPDFNLNDILALAGNFLGQADQKGNKKDENNFFDLLPSILQTFNTFVGPDAEKRAKGHEGHSALLPPILEKLHIMFDHFIHSDLGQKIIAAIGAEKSFKVFLDEHGHFSYKKFGEMMENHSYRRQWIKVVTDRVALFLQYASDPKVYKSYISGAQLFFNTYLKSQGFPKVTLFDPKRPVETISAFVNYVAKKYFEVKVNSKEYVKPAVKYVKDLLRLTEKNGALKSLSNSNELSSKLADTINLEIIEPLARVNRAYRFAAAVPKCERYVLCLVNEESQNESESLPGLKKLLYQGSSLLAGWFLASETGTPFWTLYADITENINCQKLYSSECEGFHVEELRVTTEYVHNEL